MTSIGGSGGTGGTGSPGAFLGEESEVREEFDEGRRGVITGTGKQKTSGRLSVWMSGCLSKKRTSRVLKEVETVVLPAKDSSSSFGSTGNSAGKRGEGQGLGEGQGEEGTGVARGDFLGEAEEGRKCRRKEGGGWTRCRAVMFVRRATTRGRT